MLKLKKSVKRPWIVLLTSLVLASCASVPPAPNVNLYHHDFPRAQALCSNSKGEKCDKLLLAQTDKFYMLSPKDWEKIQNYIDLLACRIRGGCQSGTMNSMGVKVSSSFFDYSDDVVAVKRRLQKIDKTLKDQRLVEETKKKPGGKFGI